MKKKKRRIRWNNVLLFFIILFFLSILIISSIQVIKWIKDSKISSKELENIQEEINIIEKEDTIDTEIITNEQEDPPKESDYWSYIKMNLIDVDFTELKQKKQ